MSPGGRRCPFILIGPNRPFSVFTTWMGVCCICSPMSPSHSTTPVTSYVFFFFVVNFVDLLNVLDYFGFKRPFLTFLELLGRVNRTEYTPLSQVCNV